jgi:hypothetical protein
VTFCLRQRPFKEPDDLVFTGYATHFRHGTEHPEGKTPIGSKWTDRSFHRAMMMLDVACKTNIIKKRVLTNTLTLVSGSDPTLFLLNLLSNLTVFWEKPGLFVCFESDPNTTYLRLLSVISGIDTQDILSGQISPRCFASLDDAATDLYHAPAYFWSPQDLDMRGCSLSLP